MTSAAALGDVALKTAAQAFAGLCGDEDLQVEQRPDFRAMQRKNAFKDQIGSWLDAAGCSGSGVLIEQVLRFVDRLALRESFEMAGQQRPIKRVGMIEVETIALIEREMVLRMVVGIERENLRGGIEPRSELAGKGGLSRA